MPAPGRARMLVALGIVTLALGGHALHEALLHPRPPTRVLSGVLVIPATAPPPDAAGVIGAAGPQLPPLDPAAPIASAVATTPPPPTGPVPAPVTTPPVTPTRAPGPGEGGPRRDREPKTEALPEAVDGDEADDAGVTRVRVVVTDHDATRRAPGGPGPGPRG